MNRCKTCKWWDTSHREYSPLPAGYGECSIEYQTETSGVFGRYDTTSGVITGPEFGCVHHEEKTDALF